MRKARRWKDDKLGKLAIIFMFMVMPAYAMEPVASTTYGAGNISQVLIGALFTIVAFFLIRTLNRFDTNLDEIFDRLRKAEEKISAIKAVCDERDC